jgi:hypothetical protein
MSQICWLLFCIITMQNWGIFVNYCQPIIIPLLLDLLLPIVLPVVLSVVSDLHFV